MLILIIFAVNTKKPQGSYETLFTINWLNLEEPLGEAAIRIRNLVDEAWNYNSHWSRITLLLSFKTLLINKDSKNPIFIGPFLECQYTQYQLYPVVHFMRNGNLKMKRCRDFVPCSLPQFRVIHHRIHFAWPLIFLLRFVLSLIVLGLVSISQFPLVSHCLLSLELLYIL